MNFYIFNSKKPYQMYLLIIFISYCIFTLLSNFLLQYYVDKKTTKNFFIEEKRSKIKHLYLQDEKIQDYIFIGSSRTLFHISTNIFKKHNLNIYNLGISGTGIAHYVYMVNRIFELEVKPKNIVISISLNKLFNDTHVDPYIDNTIDDFAYALKTKNLSVIYNTYIGLIKNSGLSTSNRTFLKKKLQELYSKYHVTYLEQKEKKLSDELYSGLDCKPFDNVDKKKEIVLCTNGDGVIIKKYMPQPFSNHTIILDKYNDNYIMYLKWLIETIHYNNSNPIIIFEPILHANYSYDMETIKLKLNTNSIIDLTHYQITDNLWADPTHLNLKGRKAYTEKLIKVLVDYQKNLLK